MSQMKWQTAPSNVLIYHCPNGSYPGEVHKENMLLLIAVVSLCAVHPSIVVPVIQNGTAPSTNPPPPL